jgi:UDP-N-acetylmuramoyl-tripeptide--D-alanyl-D-alanine ligase
MQHAAAQVPNAGYFTEKATLQDWLQTNPVQNSSVLIKGSRGMSLETLVNIL